MSAAAYKYKISVARMISTTTKLFDSHCHLQLDPLFDRAHQAISNARSCSVEQFAVCGVSPGPDWERVKRLYEQYPCILPQFGLHPWWIHKYFDMEDEPTACSESRSVDVAKLCDRLEHYLVGVLQDFPSAGVGECGLDKVIKKRVPMDVQEAVLRKHIRVAQQLVRPVTLHCVKAWGRLLELLRDMTEHFTIADHSHSICYVLHSCNRIPIDIAAAFVRIGNVYFSFNGCVPLSTSESDMIRSLPLNRLLIESDSPDQKPKWINETNKFPLCETLLGNCNEPYYIHGACISLAEALDMSPDDIARITSENARRVFCSV